MIESNQELSKSLEMSLEESCPEKLEKKPAQLAE
jgi:hypothetical protein